MHFHRGIQASLLHTHTNVKVTVLEGIILPWAFTSAVTSRSANWKECSLALKLERNNSQHLQNIPLLLEINYLYKKLHASTIAFIFSTTQGFDPVSRYKKQIHCLIRVEHGGTGMGVLTITEKYKNNIRHGLSQQLFFFSQANISFPFVIFFLTAYE